MEQSGVKRKRSSVKAANSRATTEEIAKVRGMAQRIREDKRNLNDILPLLAYCKHEAPALVHAAVQAAVWVFVDLLKDGSLHILKDMAPATTTQATVASWLLGQYSDYTDSLVALLAQPDVALRLEALDALLMLVRSETAYMSQLQNRYMFANKLYARVVMSILAVESLDQHLLQAFSDKYHLKYDDLRYHGFQLMSDVFKTTTGTLGKHDAEQAAKWQIDGSKVDSRILAANGYAVLERLRAFPSDDSRINTFWTDVSYCERGNGDKQRHLLLQTKAHRKAFSACWLAYMKLPLTTDLYRNILLLMHKRIIPFMAQPTLLMDFLTDSYNAGGAISLLALNGLFTLIQKYNLDYPDFYKKLYALFDRNLMHAKYRARFFRLSAIFLASTHIPAYLVCAFIKRMSRLSLSAPPSSVVLVIPFIYNLLKLHPSCITMIHRVPAGEEESATQQQVDAVAALDGDPYCHEEADPAKCNAVHSSLWEIQTLGDHYYANIATMSKIFAQHFNKPSYDLEDFVDHTYGTLFETEVKRRVKKAPAIAVYGEPSLVDSTEDDVSTTTSSLWRDWDLLA